MGIAAESVDRQRLPNRPSPTTRPAGLLDAERIYNNILRPSAPAWHADVLHLCGVVHAQTGRFDTAAELIGRAIDIANLPQATGPSIATFANALKMTAGKSTGPSRHFARPFALSAGDAELHKPAGDAARLLAAGQFDEAISVCRGNRAAESR